MAHQQQIDRERRETRRWARFAGSDRDMFAENPVEEDGPVRAIPLAAILNPEAFAHFSRNQSVKGPEDAIPEDVYLQQVDELEKGGHLSDIEVVLNQAEEKAKEKLQEKKEIKELDLLKPIDELNTEIESRMKNRKFRIV